MLLLLFLLLLLPHGTQAGEIIGGHEAKRHSRPYIACLQKSDKTSHCFCGGFLIREDFVLTAAHCQKSSTVVILGAHNVRNKENTQQRISVRKYIPHPDYNPETYINDIMLLKLARKATLTSTVKLLKLPSPGTSVKSGQVCSVAGWGRTSATSRQHPDTLQEVNLTIQKDSECKRLYNNYMESIQLCVGNPQKNMSSFKGDSGGPLVCNNVAQGIVSYGKINGKPPRVYTKISSFLVWIKRVLQKV